MQYPIIDNLIYAYQRNGWTGLEVIDGINLFNVDEDISNNRFYYNDAGQQIASVNYRTSNYIRIKNNTNYFWAINGVPAPDRPPHAAPRFAYFDENYTYIVSSPTLGIQGNYLMSPDNAYYIRVPVYYPNGVLYTDTAMLVEGTTIPSYFTPYAPPTTDIKNRMKLPMINYFPHPVIDALISAADGQHTDEEKEILRHYLTPLGIGGI